MRCCRCEIGDCGTKKCGCARSGKQCTSCKPMSQSRCKNTANTATSGARSSDASQYSERGVPVKKEKDWDNSSATGGCDPEGIKQDGDSIDEEVRSKVPHEGELFLKREEMEKLDQRKQTLASVHTGIRDTTEASKKGVQLGVEEESRSDLTTMEANHDRRLFAEGKGPSNTSPAKTSAAAARLRMGCPYSEVVKSPGEASIQRGKEVSYRTSSSHYGKNSPNTSKRHRENRQTFCPEGGNY